MCEQALVAAAKQGQAEAFATLCQPLARKLIQSAHRITRNREDAEDALQDALLSAFIHMKNFDGRSSFSTWLTRIAINSALMTLRKKRSSREIPIGDCGVDGELIGGTRLGQKALLKMNCVRICRGHFNREFGFNVG
jgi:RNA polymerase sigma-70 factor (ECF subfamily)